MIDDFPFQNVFYGPNYTKYENIKTNGEVTLQIYYHILKKDKYS